MKKLIFIITYFKIDKIEEELFNNDSESEEIEFESDDSS